MLDTTVIIKQNVIKQLYVIRVIYYKVVVKYYSNNILFDFNCHVQHILYIK